MRIAITTSLLCIIFLSCSKKKSYNEVLNKRIDSILVQMTLQEKIGQMAMLSSWGRENQPLNEDESYIEEIKAGRVGSMLNINGTELTYRLQKIALEESRLGIPLIFGFDVIHGYKTIFPIPLALASTWDTSMVKKVSEIAAEEATAAGQHWTFAPMVDVTRDPRWGRIAECTGEDPFLTSAMAIAQVKGFQGNDLSDEKTLAACAKHFVAYGAAEGGRDYNTCEVSERTLQEIYLPPFKAASDFGVASIMMALNDLNGIPSSASEELKNILRNDWNYQSVLVSDWNSIGELISQGKAPSAEEAAFLAFKTSIDIDLQGNIYVNQIEKLVQDGLLSEKDVDKSVRRILGLKFKLGLFDDPYKYCNPGREKETLLKDSFKDYAEKVAQESIILLQNKNQRLPLTNKYKQIAVVGPLAKNKTDILGSWRAFGDTSDAISIFYGLVKNMPDINFTYAKGCEIDGSNKSGFSTALKIAKKANAIIVVMGESSPVVNKTLSASDISLPGVQRDLLKELVKTGKPVILVLLNGRPVSLDWESKNIDAIVEAWFPGTMSGNAVGNILSGKANPCAKLPVSFPFTTGQIPVYYNHKKFGRTPLPNNSEQAKYDDGPVDALFPFGHGLSYTTYEYSDLSISNKQLSKSDTVNIRITVANIGEYDGAEIVQLYIRDLIGNVTRPISELKGFKKIFLKKGQSQEIQFKLPVSELAFYDINLNKIIEPGEFSVMVGTSSVKYLSDSFFITDSR